MFIVFVDGFIYKASGFVGSPTAKVSLLENTTATALKYSFGSPVTRAFCNSLVRNALPVTPDVSVCVSAFASPHSSFAFTALSVTFIVSAIYFAHTPSLLFNLFTCCAAKASLPSNASFSSPVLVCSSSANVALHNHAPSSALLNFWTNALCASRYANTSVNFLPVLANSFSFFM